MKLLSLMFFKIILDFIRFCEKKIIFSIFENGFILSYPYLGDFRNKFHY